jgi:hypothetical protein
LLASETQVTGLAGSPNYYAVSAVIHKGAQGGNGTYQGAGGTTIYGGAGGGDTAGISTFGGNGGKNGSNPTAGSIPGGGGGGGDSNKNGADGARGEVRIYTW